ncbi:protein kinase domain-containing protein [Alicyclobacillus ferrooxydans]|uniref:protein kinase domain-containing protein n=1 Tax=Alicyclobacillus ferrooxydans TaxID=471514 RepID=UPI0006D5788A|nr:phosphotransferase [Alicyclobacillus ferrooxydans]
MLAQGARFTTKWSHTPIVVEGSLGEGANGTVYLVRTPLGQAAMKVCNASADVAMEWALLTSLGQGANAFPKPMLIDDGPPEAPFFYIMERIPGQSLGKVLAQGDFALVSKVFEKVLDALVDLHQTGYAFCDLKPENVIVTTGRDVSIRFVDVGGITRFGRAVRQYTPLCDRAFFGMGSRKAEPSYDLFALLLGLLTSATKEKTDDLSKLDPARRLRLLEQTMQRFPVEAVPALLKSLQSGKVTTALELKKRWSDLPDAKKQIQPQHAGKARTLRRTQTASQQTGAGVNRSPKGRARPQRRSRMDWTERLMWLSLGSAGIASAAAWAVLMGWLPS